MITYTNFLPLQKSITLQLNNFQLFGLDNSKNWTTTLSLKQDMFRSFNDLDESRESQMKSLE